MKRWDALRDVLSKKSFHERKKLFLEFVDEHDRWSNQTFEVLSKVVVHLMPQYEVVEKLGLYKQSLNRSVKFYKEFLYRKGIK